MAEIVKQIIKLFHGIRCEFYSCLLFHSTYSQVVIDEKRPRVEVSCFYYMRSVRPQVCIGSRTTTILPKSATCACVYCACRLILAVLMK